MGKASEKRLDCLMGLPLGTLMGPSAPVGHTGTVIGDVVSSRHGAHKLTGRAGEGPGSFLGRAFVDTSSVLRPLLLSSTHLWGSQDSTYRLCFLGAPRHLTDGCHWETESWR